MAYPLTRTAPADYSTSEVLRQFDFDQNATPMWVFDVRTLSFLAVNDAAVRNYGYARNEFLAMTILDIRPCKDIVPLLRKQLQRGIHHAEGELWTHERKDRTLVEVEINSREILFNGQKAVLVTAAHVSTQQQNDSARPIPWQSSLTMSNSAR